MPQCFNSSRSTPIAAFVIDCVRVIYLYTTQDSNNVTAPRIKELQIMPVATVASSTALDTLILRLK